MESYLRLLTHILGEGTDSGDRTGTGTRKVFGYQFRHLMANGFPLLTTKKVHFKSVLHELLFFISGSTNVKDLQKHGVKIWDEWAKEDGDLGPIYGKQWNDWDGEINQLHSLVNEIRSNPNSRRHIVTAWNPSDVKRMALPPCHTLWQVGIVDDYINLHLYARSIDSFLGLPFNIASYALMLEMLASITGFMPGELIISFGDLHIYQNHMQQVRTQLAREPRTLPTLLIKESGQMYLDDFVFEDFELKDYNPHPAIPAPVAV